MRRGTTVFVAGALLLIAACTRTGVVSQGPPPPAPRYRGSPPPPRTPPGESMPPPPPLFIGPNTTFEPALEGSFGHARGHYGLRGRRAAADRRMHQNGRREPGPPPAGTQVPWLAAAAAHATGRAVAASGPAC